MIWCNLALDMSRLTTGSRGYLHIAYLVAQYAIKTRQRVRVVKEIDLNHTDWISIGFGLAGSNPVVVDYFCLLRRFEICSDQ